MTEEEVRAEVGTKAIKFIDEHEKDCLTGFEMMRDFAYEVIKDLEKENAELKCECRRCVYTDCPCVLSDYGKDRNGICDHFKNVFDENAELKEKFLKIKVDDVRESELDSFKTLEEKNEYLRRVAIYAIVNKDISVITWCFMQRGAILTDQLTKAKELLKRFIELENCTLDYDNIKEAEQFISEVEKCLRKNLKNMQTIG